VPFQAPKEQENGQDEDVGIFAEINITPLTDVILVLLIIFMVSSSAMVDAMREGKLDVTLPQAGQAANAGAEAETLVVGMAQDGRLFVKGQFVSEDQLAEILEETHKSAPGTVIIVDADGKLEHRSVVGVIDKVKSAGFNTVGIGAESDGE
jgi:biopolymer transport protein ExbD